MEYLRKSYFLIELHDTCKIDQMEYSMATIWSTPYASYIQPRGVLHRMAIWSTPHGHKNLNCGVLHRMAIWSTPRGHKNCIRGVLHRMAIWSTPHGHKNLNVAMKSKSIYIIEKKMKNSTMHKIRTIWSTPYDDHMEYSI